MSRAHFTQHKMALLLSLAALASVFLLLNVRTLSWPFGIVDAPILIAQAIQYSPIEYFLTPDAYNFLSYNNYTPFVTLSWDIDYTLFGLHEPAYRLHQLGSLLILVGLIYVVLLQATRSIGIATLFCFAFINLPATYSVLDVMVNRHYIEGMIFAILSYLACRRYDHTERTVWLVVSVICYGIAATAKEVYLPLPGLLFFLISGNIVRRIKTIVPFAAMLALYLAARFYMIGGAGGYSGAAETAAIFDNLNVLAGIALQTLAGLFAQPLVSFCLLIAMLLLILREFGKQSVATKFALLMGLAGALLPIIALIPMMAAGFVMARWLFVPSVLALVYIGYLCSRSESRAIPALVYCLLFSSSVYAAYERYAAPDPLFTKGQGRNYKAIMASDEKSYVLFSNFSQLAAENYSVWVYIAKLKNGHWGTLPIVSPPQASYHDLSQRTRIPMGGKARKANFLSRNIPVREDVVESATLDQNGLVTVALNSALPGNTCSVYLFNEHNGIVFGHQNCQRWVSLHQQIIFQLRKAGLTLEDAQFAVWSDDAEHPWRSKPYALSELLERSSG
ncbi:MAG: hypothetical protein AB8C02_02180 [Halioglobus sp.]